MIKQLMQPAMVVIEVALFTFAYLFGIGLAALFVQFQKHSLEPKWCVGTEKSDYMSRY